MIILDVTELIANPIRAGIQRVVRELIRRWPADVPMRVARYDPTEGLVAVPDSAVELVTDCVPESAESPTSEVALRVASQLRRGGPTLPNNGRVLVPEVFYEDRRCAYHQARLRADPASVAFIVYDFIPWLHPDRIGVEQSAHLMPYLRLLRTARRLAFISGATRADYARRVMRGRGVNGIVLPLGCDSLGLARQAFSAGRRGFLCIGSIDGRKNQDRVLRAFQMLWARGHEIPLTVVGDAFPRVDVTEFEATRSHRLFAWHRHAGDAIVGDLLRTARGTIYASEIEGYGIPPMESLYAGVPVICAEALPSVAELPFAGQVRLAKITPETIADAVVMLSNDDIAARLWKEAQHLTLATWGDFARQTASWMQSAVSPTDPPAATN